MCRGRESNSHEFPRTILSRMRLPIPPPRRACVVLICLHTIGKEKGCVNPA